MNQMTAISAETLLEHAGFVRALARELLRSSDRVDGRRPRREREAARS